MKQQIIVSGTGGQGILFLTRFFAEAAMMMKLQVLTRNSRYGHARWHGRVAREGGTLQESFSEGGSGQTRVLF